MKEIWKLIFLVVLVSSSVVYGFSKLQDEEDPTEELYIRRCAGCHGVDGHPLRPNMPDFTARDFQRSHTDEQIQATIIKGKPPRMPSFKSKLDEAEIKALVAYVRSFAKQESGARDQELGIGDQN